jgi:Na+-transporting methylmalonyl-CoA/oxaloacetate decarboxylase gamma subunit
MGIFEHVVISQAVVLSNVNSYINMNTLFGVVAVLAVLLLIALVYLVNIMSYLKNSNSDKAVSSANNVVAQTVSKSQGELVGDHELVAVITAAIYASMGDSVPADGFVVRSIRKVR